MGASLLATDGYKFSMAEAGWPLRQETFYYCHRRGGPQVVPLDVEPLVRALLPRPLPEDYAYLAASGYEMGAGFRAAVLRGEQLRVRALPRGAVFLPREPVLSVTGPSVLVSWLEPLLLQLNFRIQVATGALQEREGLARALGRVTCEAQRQVVLETLDAVGVAPFPITVDEEGYYRRVRATVRELVESVGDPARIFEVGLRAATCLEQHLVALRACRDEGVVRTSHVLGARMLGLVPVGTMGHEHVQRYGADEPAFRAMRERRPQRSSYLLDTYDTLALGLPAALRLIAEDPAAGDSIRFDSGHKGLQYLYAVVRSREQGLSPVYILEDGLDAAATRELEGLRQQAGVPPAVQFYGYGGHIVARPMDSPLTRDRVAAVYKLSQTGPVATMKFGDEAAEGKQSIPGRPIVFRRQAGRGPLGLVGQEGEEPPEGYVLLTGAPERPPLLAELSAAQEGPTVGYTPATRALVEALRPRVPR